MHELAIELMNKLDNKYNMNNMLSLDEYLYEYYNVLSNNEINTINELLQMWIKLQLWTVKCRAIYVLTIEQTNKVYTFTM